MTNLSAENPWQAIWKRKGDELQRSSESIDLAYLLDADGFNTGFGSIEEEAWTEFVLSTCSRLRLKAGDSLFEVGSGAGAFLYLPHQQGIHVSGVDYSAGLVDTAQRAMPSGSFTEEDAASFAVGQPVDAAVAFSVFLYFADLQYARRVIERMCRKATRSVALLDVPDAHRAAEALAIRQKHLGGPEAYAERYRGLDHQTYERAWIKSTLEEFGAHSVTIEDQSISGYGNGRYRFNAFARLD